MLALSQQSPIRLLVYTIPGCPACEEYVPRLRRLYAYARSQGICVPQLEIINANAPNQQEAANYFDIKFTPTTVILKPNGKWKKWDSSLEDGEAWRVLMLASQAHYCEI